MSFVTNKKVVDNQKIAIISCVNDERMYKEACFYIDHLEIPNGMQVEILSVYDAESITSGYQEAMLASNARYKIYIHQDVFLVRKNILAEIVKLFQDDAKIGLIGLIGAKNLNGGRSCWWEDTEQCGALVGKEAPEKAVRRIGVVADDVCMDVEAIDGAFMATQYDLPWRTDLFKGWHFYDTSQTFEFRNAGYRTVIPRQTEPWFVHFNGRNFPGKDYEEAMAIFARNYRW